MPEEGQRIDRWLWFARLTKSRTLAASLVSGGKVRVNRRKVIKPGHVVRPGDILTVRLRSDVRIFEVLAPGARRGPAKEAQTLYCEIDPENPDEGPED